MLFSARFQPKLASACCDSACFGFFSSPLAIEKVEEGSFPQSTIIIYAPSFSLLKRIYCKIWANETYNKQSQNPSFLIKGHFLAFRGLASNMKLYFCIPHDPVYQLYNYQLEMNDLPVREKCVWIIRQYILMLIQLVNCMAKYVRRRNSSQASQALWPGYACSACMTY